MAAAQRMECMVSQNSVYSDSDTTTAESKGHSTPHYFFNQRGWHHFTGGEDLNWADVAPNLYKSRPLFLDSVLSTIMDTFSPARGPLTHSRPEVYI